MEGNLGRIQRLVDRAWGQVTSPLYRNAIYILSSSVIGAGLGFFFWIIVYRTFRDEDIAVVVPLFGTVSFVSTLALFGLGTGLIRFLPETEEKTQLVNACLTVVGLAGLLFAAVFLVGINVWAGELNFVLESPVYVLAILVTSAALAFAPILDQVAYAMRHADVLMWRTVALAVLKIPFAIVFAAIAITSGRLGVFMALAVPSVAAVALEGYVLVPRVLKGYRPRFSRQMNRIRPIMAFSAGNYVANTVGGAAGSLLPLLVLEVAGKNPVNYYYVASVVAGLLGIIPGAAFTSLYAEASQKGSRGLARHHDERRAILLSIGLLIPAMVVMWVFAQIMLELFGGGSVRFAEFSVTPLRILMFAAIPGFLNSIYSTRVRVRKRTLPLIVGTTISTIATFALGYPLLVQYGIEGLSVAVVVAGFVATPYYYFTARRSYADEEIEEAGMPPMPE